MNQNNPDFYINSLSYSQLRTFISNTWEWQNNRLLSIYDNTCWVSSAVWTILHKFVETYLKTWVLEKAYEHCHKCIYDWVDWLTYIIDPNEIDIKNASLNDVKKHIKTKVVDFKKTWSNEWILKDVKAWIEAFLSEEVDYGELLWVEKSMQYDAIEILWGNIEVRSPIPFTAISDEICRTNKERTLLINWELQTIPSWSIFIEDTKFKNTHSEMNAEDPTYIFQAFFNYYCVKAEYWEAPKFMTFREIKTSKNKDWSSQHQTITIPFFGEVFEEYKVYFWRYILETFERIKIIQERDFLFNIFDMFNGSKEWEKQKAYYLWVPVWTLKSRIAMTSKNKVASNVPVMWDRDPFQNSKKTKWDITSEDLHSIENKIRVAFQNFGVVVKFEKKIDWFSYDQFLFTPARWITMARIKALKPEIIQALELDWVRIEAPVLWTKFIWVEVPRKERKFAKLEKIPKGKKPIIPIWVDVSWESTLIDLSDSWNPHMIVAGKTWSWKSEFMKSAIYALKDKWEIIIIDPKRVWLSEVKSLATEYYVDIEETEIKLACLRLEMDQIYLELEKMWAESIYHEKAGWKFTRKFIFIDEFASLAYAVIQRDVTDWKWLPKVINDNIWERIIQHVLQITNLWRAAWIHLILATQRPDIKVIPGNIKANISTRVCFALATDIDSKVVLWEPWAEKLLSKWDMIFMNEWTQKRLQWFYI